MVDGRRVFNKLKRRRDEAKSSYEGHLDNLRSSERELVRQTSQREDLFVELAQFYLPELSRDSISETLRGVKGEVKDIFEEKLQRMDQLDGSLKKTQKTIDDLETHLEGVVDSLDIISKRRDELVEKVQTQLEEDKEYGRLFKEGSQKEGQVTQNKERLEEFRNLAARNLPGYHGNALFMYLVNNKFGTEDYRGSGIVKNIDRALAAFIDFTEQKKTFDALSSNITLMEIEVQSREDDLNLIKNKVAEYEKSVEDDLGLTAVIQSGEKTSEKRSKIQSEIESNEEAYSRMLSERESLNSNEGRFYSKAIRYMKDVLEDKSIADLYKHAKKTKDRKDDAIVERIDTLNSEISSTQEALEHTRSQTRAWEEKYDGLRKITRKFERNDYEGSRSEFSYGFNIDSLVENFIAGSLSERRLWRKIDNAQSFKPRRSSYSSSSYSSSSRRSSSSSSSSSWSGSSSFGGGGFSSGGGSGGGGFSTGGGF